MEKSIAQKEKWREASKRYRAKHPELCRERWREYSKRRYAEHPEIVRERNKKYQVEHLEKFREYSKRWYAENPEKARAFSHERYKRYRARHPEKVREKSRRNHEKHREKELAHGRVYCAEHPEKSREKKHKGRSRELAVIGNHFTEEEWNELLDRTGRKCLCCGATNVSLQRDHVIPLVLGIPHSDEISNIQPLCAHCNTSKHTKTIDYRKE